MNISIAKKAAITFAIASIYALAALAAPGNPIGGIIVKGGKNPGGKIHTLTTTDRNGEFTINFSEGGEYRLFFAMEKSNQPRNRTTAEMRLEYIIRSRSTSADRSSRSSATAAESAAFFVKIDRRPILVTIPGNGGTLSGKIQSANTSGDTRESTRRAQGGHPQFNSLISCAAAQQSFAP